MRGNVDVVTSEGIVEGWCWNEEAPANRVTVAIHVDGEECGRAVACHFRKDLQEAGIGDGGHFFRLILPDTVLRHRRSQKVALVEPASGKAIGDPYEVRFEHGLKFDDRLNELEARSRLLESRLQELADVTDQGKATAQLFAVVGTFFQRLAGDLSRGTIPGPELELGHAIQATTRSLPPITFATSLDPFATIFVQANCPLGQLHTCLAALRRAASGVAIRVIILDAGSYDDTVLICSLVQGIHYVRMAADIVSELKLLGGGETSSVLIFLSGYAVVDQIFLSELHKFIELNSYVGAAGGCSLGPDGRLQQVGFCIVEGQLIDAAAAGVSSLVTTMPAALSVHALGHAAVAFRRRALEAVGGPDPMYGDDLWAAVIDLCFRLRAAGWSVFANPSALFSLSPGREAPAIVSKLTTPSRAKDLLVHRWINNPEASACANGCAAIIGQPDRMAEETEAVSRLRSAGFHVLYWAADALTTRDIANLQRVGGHIVSSDDSFADAPARIIFTATDGGRVEKCRSLAMPGAQIVIGLPSLTAALQRHEAAASASLNA